MIVCRIGYLLLTWLNHMPYANLLFFCLVFSLLKYYLKIGMDFFLSVHSAHTEAHTKTRNLCMLIFPNDKKINVDSRS